MQFTLLRTHIHTHMHKHTHAKNRLAVVTHWPSNRCCEQCESWATPALLCCSTSSSGPQPLIQTQRATVPASPLPQPGHLSAWPLSVPCPPPPSVSPPGSWFPPHRGQAIESLAPNSHTHTVKDCPLHLVGKHILYFLRSSHTQKYACTQIRAC